eukprot:3940832-Amphidinium_carterae.1
MTPSLFPSIKEMPLELRSRIADRVGNLVRADCQSLLTFRNAWIEAESAPYFVGDKATFKFLKTCYNAIETQGWASFVYLFPRDADNKTIPPTPLGE